MKKNWRVIVIWDCERIAILKPLKHLPHRGDRMKIRAKLTDDKIRIHKVLDVTHDTVKFTVEITVCLV